MSGRLPAHEVVLGAVADALSQVAARDRDLLELQAHELALVHRFAVYLESRLEPHLRRCELTIDLDYDRQGDRQKFLPPRPGRPESDPSRFRPDLIIHRRRTSAHDLLVAEWKKSASIQVLGRMQERVQLLLAGGHPDSPYNYQLGLLVNSGDDGISWRSIDSDGTISGWQRVSAGTAPHGAA